jgi:hypothetical protein
MKVARVYLIVKGFVQSSILALKFSNFVVVLDFQLNVLPLQLLKGFEALELFRGQIINQTARLPNHA